VRYIKTYEHNNKNMPKFKIGDKVYLKNNNYEDFIKDKKYTIRKIDRINKKIIFYKLEYGYSTNVKENDLISEIDYNTNKFNL
jgi:hypothetical protein